MCPCGFVILDFISETQAPLRSDAELKAHRLHGEFMPVAARAHLHPLRASILPDRGAATRRLTFALCARGFELCADGPPAVRAHAELERRVDGDTYDCI